MCLSIFSIYPKSLWPIVLAFIREEVYLRPWDFPGYWWPKKYPEIFAPIDRMSGGTWIALNFKKKSLAALLNFPKTLGPSPNKKSRGWLPLEIASTNILTQETARAFRGFHIISFHNQKGIWWSWNEKDLLLQSIPEGIHLIDAFGMDNLENSPRQARWHPILFNTLDFSDEKEIWNQWKMLLAQISKNFAQDYPQLSFIEKKLFGPVSATLIGISSDQKVHYEFCPGPPHRVPWSLVQKIC